MGFESLGVAVARSRGEHQQAAADAALAWGSSPLARGTPGLKSRGRGWHGLIPARAGNTAPRNSRCASHRAHPRSRGEHVGFSARCVPLPGSSPLARGTRRRRRARSRGLGLIPARAGNTVRRAALHAGGWAHPRSRGEHQNASASVKGTAGSSPLARGTPHH